GERDRCRSWHRNECLCVARRETPLSDHLDHGIRKGEQAKQIGDRRAILPSGVSNLLMSKLEFLGEALISASLINWIEVASLQVLHERHHQARAIVEILD